MRRGGYVCAIVAALSLAALLLPLATTGQANDTILLRIAGDDVSGTSIVPLIAQRFLESRGAVGVEDAPPPPGWTCEIRGTLVDGSHIAVLIRATGSSDGFLYLQHGWADIGLSARRIRPAEVRALAKLGDMTGTAASYVMANAAIEMVDHAGNGLTSISFQQLRDLYGGHVYDWSQLGGSPGPIHVFARSPGSASRDVFDENVMGSTHYGSNVRFFNTFGAMRSALIADPSAIGYLQLGSTDPLSIMRLRVGSHLDPAADKYGVSSGDYPLRLQLTLYFSPNPQVNAQAIADFVHEAQSAASQTDVIFADFFRVGSQLLIPEVDNDAADAYRKLADGNATRVNITIHFSPGSTKMTALDIEAIGRLASYLRFLQVPGSEIVLVGFSDDNGSAAKNLAVSEDLDNLVVADLEELHVPPPIVIALGEQEPLASDFTAVGRQLNRRVETWILP